MNRAAVFIDIGYFGKVLKYCFGEPRINFEKFSDLLCNGRERLRTYIYDCTPFQNNPPTEEEIRRAANHERFINSLARLNRFEIRLGRTARNLQTGEFYQKRIEVLLTVDLMRMAWSRQIDTAILVTGENDFVPAIQSAKNAGLLIVIYFRDCFDPQGRSMTRTTEEILGVCDECMPITDELITQSKF
ncbi:MAG: NYN domain-containing protein [Candidatus Thorarchaeota archaeon]|nr:NYN domain-containing protein [Candidatus Thorarchaeota archaeon]